MIIAIPFKTPTINHLYGQNNNRRFLTKEAKELKEQIADIVRVKHFNTEDYDNKPLKVSVRISEDWLCKDKSIKRKDIANREKFLIDSIFDALGLDDKLIFVHIMEKVQSKDEHAIVSIVPLPY